MMCVCVCLCVCVEGMWGEEGYGESKFHIMIT